ncbi:hypothetical protein ACIP3A_03885 [Streptomyces tricolor]|uniref:hypothetical protein n=1 Tax=Streptomyces tricolor TaxID=68277 RepID=UPI00382BB6D2
MTLFTHRNAGGRCPCGAENAACGPPSNVVPVDQLIEEVPAMSGPLKKYRVKRGGVETVMKLSDDDAKRLGVSVDQAVDAAPTVQPVQPAETGTPQAPSLAASAAGDMPTSGPDDGDGQEPAEETAPDGDGQEAAQDGQEAAKKAAAKRRPTAANKARAASANKVADGGS